MTDARFPERWLNDRRILRLSDAGFRLFMISLTWSVSNRSDGVLVKTDLDLMYGVDPMYAGELEEAGLWSSHDGERDGGWLIVDFDQTQTARAQLEGLDLKRRQDRERSRRYRARQSSRDSSRDDKGQDRTGQDKHLEGEFSWPEVTQPGGAP